MKEEIITNWKGEEEIDRYYVTHKGKKLTNIIDFLVRKIRWWQQKEEINQSDDKEVENLLYWVADYIPIELSPFRLNTIKNQLWGIRDRFHNDKLA